MAIKPVTFPGAVNFKSNLYALDVKTRFIDQSVANGFYTDYGDELAAIVSSNEIKLGSGAFLVQGRMVEIDSGGASVTVPIQNGYYGYLCARIETYHPNDTQNCTLIVKSGIDFSDISLVQEDTLGSGAESENRVYELPLYSFKMSGDAITELNKVISPINTLEVLNQKIESARRYVHHIAFEFGYFLSNTWEGYIYCTIVNNSPIPIGAEAFCMYEIAKEGAQIMCNGYFYTGGKIPMLLQYVEGNISVKMHYIDLDQNGTLNNRDIQLLNIRNFSDTVT